MHLACFCLFGISFHSFSCIDQNYAFFFFFFPCSHLRREKFDAIFWFHIFFLISYIANHQGSPNATALEVLECSKGFYRDNGSSACIPNCHTWKEYSDQLSLFMDVMVLIAAVIGFLASVAVLVISCLTHKRV